MATKKASKRRRGEDDTPATAAGASFTDFLHTSLKDYPEDQMCPIGTFRFLCKGYKIDEKSERVVFTQQPLEPVDVPAETAKFIASLDGAPLQPVFDSFNCQTGMPGRSMLKRRFLDAGLDQNMQTIPLCKAMVGIHGIAEVVHSPNKDDPKRPFANLRNWRRA